MIEEIMRYLILILMNLCVVSHVWALEEEQEKRSKDSQAVLGRTHQRQAVSRTQKVDYEDDRARDSSNHSRTLVSSQSFLERNDDGEDASEENSSGEETSREISKRDRREAGAAATEGDEVTRSIQKLKKRRKESSSEEWSDDEEDVEHHHKKREEDFSSVKEIIMTLKSKYQEDPNAGYDTEPLLEDEDALGHIRARIKEKVHSLKEGLTRLKDENASLLEQQKYLEDQVGLNFPSRSQALREIKEILLYETKVQVSVQTSFISYLEANKYGIEEVISQIVKTAKRTGQVWTRTDIADAFFKRSGFNEQIDRFVAAKFNTFLKKRNLEESLAVPRIEDVLAEHQAEVDELVKEFLKKTSHLPSFLNQH